MTPGPGQKTLCSIGTGKGGMDGREAPGPVLWGHGGFLGWNEGNVLTFCGGWIWETHGESNAQGLCLFSCWVLWDCASVFSLGKVNDCEVFSLGHSNNWTDADPQNTHTNLSPFQEERTAKRRESAGPCANLERQWPEPGSRSQDGRVFTPHQRV